MKDFVYYDYGYLSCKTKDEVYQVLNKHTVVSVKKYAINKYYEQTKPISTLESIKKKKRDTKPLRTRHN